MRKLVLSGFGLLLLVGLTYNCKSQQPHFTNNPDFKITDTYIQHYVGGQPGISGDNVVIEVFNNTRVIPDSIYFKNRVSRVEVKKSSENRLWIGRFENPKRLDRYHSESDVPIESPTAVFQLLDYEAVIVYSQNGRKYYYKLKNIPVKEPLYLP